MRVAKHVLTLLWLVAVTPVLGESLTSLSVADLSQRLAEVESRIQDLDVRMTVTSQYAVGPAPGRYVTSVRWVFKAPFGSRFRLEQEGIKPWDRGARDTLALSGTIAFDGVDSWSLWRTGGNMDEALSAPAHGNILGGKDPAVDLGEGYRQVTFWRHGQPLSEVIQAIPGVIVEVDNVEDVGPVYRVSVPWNKKEGEDWIGPETIYLDPARGYAIVRVEEPSLDPTVLNNLLRVTALTEAEPFLWIPTQGASESRRSGQITYSWHCQVQSVKLNTNVPEELFSIDYPAGTMVSDLRTKITFKVGFNAQGADEAMEAQARAARAAVDQLAAGDKVQLPVLPSERTPIPSFAPETKKTQAELPRWLTISGLAFGLALAFVLGLTAIRVRRARPVLFCVLLAIGAAGLALSGAATYVLAKLPSTCMAVANAPDTSRVVFDCGRAVLGVLAKYYGTDWRAEDIARHTGPTPGMSLLEIRDTARAMGLHADGVKLSTIEQLQRVLSEPRSALVLATSLDQGEYQAGHFFCVVGVADEYFIAIDPPRPVHLITSEDTASAITRGKGYALLIHP